MTDEKLLKWWNLKSQLPNAFGQGIWSAGRCARENAGGWFKTDTTKIKKKESPLSEQQQKQNLPPKRCNVESQSHRGFLSALYTLSALYFTLLVLNCTPWMGCVCHLSAFYLTVALNNSSSVLPGLGVECISLDHSLDPFHHENRKQREVKRRQEQKEKIGGCTYPALLSLVTLNAHKIQPTLLW